MKQSRFSEQQIDLHQAEEGVAVEDVCPKAGIPMRSYYGGGWNMAASCRRRHFGGLWPCPERTVVSPRPSASRQRPRMLYQRGKAYSQDLRERVSVRRTGDRVGEAAELARVSLSYASVPPFRKSLRFEQA